MKSADIRRAPNRALIEELFNGFPPYTAKEEKDNHISVNVNFREGTNLLLQAREQYENAFLSPQHFFQVKIPLAPNSRRAEYEEAVTSEVSAVMKSPKYSDSRKYLHTFRSKVGSVCLHGPGSQMWEDQWKWLPFFVPIEDLLIPTDTEITLENLTHFAVRRRMSYGQLYRKTFGKGKNMDPGWNRQAVSKVLDSYKDLNQQANNWNWAQNPEKMQELVKQNALCYDTDSSPKIGFWDFYYQGDEEKTCWYRCMLLDSDCVQGNGTSLNSPLDFIYARKNEPFAETLDQIIHIQFGDGNNKPPFLYHSVRSLGWLLFDVVHLMNRLRCQFTQKVFEDMMNLFRVTDPADRSRLDHVYLGLRYGIVPEGLNFVRNEERSKLDPNLVEGAMAMMKQLMGESTSSYTQDIDSGTEKERTAFEVQTLLAQTTKLTGSMLNLAYLQEVYAYQEICRRLTLKKTPDFTAKKFQERLRERGVPVKWIDANRWDIMPERVLGYGNAQLELAQAQSLLGIRPLLNPTAQQIVLHDYAFAVTHDAKKAQEIAPRNGAPAVSDTTHDTELAFGALMRGIQVTPKPGLNPIEVVETSLRLMAGEVQRISRSGGVGTPQDVMGLMNAAQYASAFLKQLALDQNNKALVKKYNDILAQLLNEVKAMSERQQEAASKQNGKQFDPEILAKIQGEMAVLKQKLAAKEQQHQQKMAHNEQKFAQGQRIKEGEALAKVQTDAAVAVAGAARPEEKT